LNQVDLEIQLTALASITIVLAATAGGPTTAYGNNSVVPMTLGKMENMMPCNLAIALAGS